MIRRMSCGVALASLLSLASVVSAETVKITPAQGDSIVEDTSPVPLVTRPKSVMVWTDVDPATVLPAVNTNKIYLNNCKPNGCVIRSGQTSSIDGTGYQGTWGIQGTKTLTPFGASDAVWQQVVSCLKDVFSPFAVEITTTNPSPANHFEIMIAGSPGDVGMSQGVGGVSPFSCQPYIPNSLVFDFQKVWGTNVEEICATAAQEIAHSFALDHVIDPSDPLTYYNYNGRRRFKDAQVQCGSDCQGGQSPFGDTCSGTNQQSHDCSCTNNTTILTNTQNSFQTIKALFGGGTPTPPTVTITAPKNNDNVPTGFPIKADIMDDIGASKAELRIDGQLVSTLMQSPWVWNAPASVGQGTHTIKVTGYDVGGTPAEAQVQIVIGAKCTKPGDCASETDTCVDGRCVAGEGVTGGLGSGCTKNEECKSGQCGMDGTTGYCVEMCDPALDACPSGFDCLASGAVGVCWPGSGGGGGCNSTDGSGGAVMLGLGLGALLITRRRTRR